MKALDNLSSYVRQSTRKREIMDEETARIVVLYVTRFFSEVDACLSNSTTLKNQLRAWLVEKRHEQTRKPLMVATKQLIAKFVGGYCKDGGWLSDDDYIKLQRAFKPQQQSWSLKALSDDDVLRVIRYFTPRANNCLSRSRDLLAVMTMLAVGLRIGQVVALTQDDVQQINNDFIVRPLLQKKVQGGKSRKNIPLDIKIGGLEFETAMDWYSKFRYPRSEYYFHNKMGNKVSTDYYRGVFSKCEKRLGITLSAHSFRHTAGTRTATKVGVIQAALLLDHESIQTTQRYISLPKDTADIVSKSFQ